MNDYVRFYQQVEKLERRESVVSSQSEGGDSTAADEAPAATELDPDCIVQEPREETSAASRAAKTRLTEAAERRLTALPAMNRDSELSSLCSIM